MRGWVLGRGFGQCGTDMCGAIRHLIAAVEVLKAFLSGTMQQGPWTGLT